MIAHKFYCIIYFQIINNLQDAYEVIFQNYLQYLKYINMKKFVLLLVIMMISYSHSYLYAQNDCKYRTDKVDAFTGDVYRLTWTKLFYQMFGIDVVKGWEIGYERIGDKYNMIHGVTISAEKKEFIEKGDSIMIKIDNGSQIVLYSNKKYDPHVYGDQTTYSAAYSISYDDLITLTTNNIVYLRMIIDQRWYDFDISKFKKADNVKQQLMHSARCITKKD